MQNLDPKRVWEDAVVNEMGLGWRGQRDKFKDKTAPTNDETPRMAEGFFENADLENLHASKYGGAGGVMPLNAAGGSGKPSLPLLGQAPLVDQAKELRSQAAEEGPDGGCLDGRLETKMQWVQGV